MICQVQSAVTEPYCVRRMEFYDRATVYFILFFFLYLFSLVPLDEPETEIRGGK